MLTIFATPKPFRGNIQLIQQNAIRSWAKLEPACKIILFGDEEGTAEIADKLGLCHIPDIARNEFGTPLVNSMFELAGHLADTDLLCYVNADIILMSDFMACVAQLAGSLPDFLMVGRRWDLDTNDLLEFSPGWEGALRQEARARGRLHAHTGIDFLVFRRTDFIDLPPFPVGRPGWDNYLIYSARMRGMPVVDVSEACLVVHQNHDYSHHPQGVKGYQYGPEAQQSWKLSGDGAHLLDLRDANYRLDPGGHLRETRMLDYPIRRLFTLPMLHMHWDLPARIIRSVLRLSRQKLSDFNV